MAPSYSASVMGRRGPQAGGQEKEAGGGGESAQLHPDLGGAGREPGPQPASRPHSTCASCTWLPNEEPRNSKPRPLRFPSIGSSSPAPVPPLPGLRVLGWVPNASRAGATEGRREGNTRCRGDRGGRSSLCNGAGRQRPMGWRPRLLLNENKRSTWPRLRSHVSPPGLPGAVGVLPGAGHHSAGSSSAAPCCH